MTIASVSTAEIPNGITSDNPLLGTGSVPAGRPAAPWTVNIVSGGNTNRGTGVDIDTAIVHSPTSIGEFQTLNTPSYLFLQIRNSEADQSTGIYAEQELLIIEAPADTDAEAVAEEFILRIRRANPRLSVRDTGNAGQFAIQPSNYGDLANFILVPTVNDLVGLDECRRLLAASVYHDGMSPDMIQLHPASAIPFINILRDSYLMGPITLDLVVWVILEQLLRSI